jgi:hypothetical protein
MFKSISTAAFLATLTSHAAAQEPRHVDGILDFRENGVSEVEFVVGDALGRVSIELTFPDGAPFTIADGTCQIASIFNADELSRTALGVNDNGHWVANLTRMADISESPERGPVLGIQCFRR